MPNDGGTTAFQKVCNPCCICLGHLQDLGQIMLVRSLPSLLDEVCLEKRSTTRTHRTSAMRCLQVTEAFKFVKAARRIYSASGTEITELPQIQDGMMLVISMGEKFKYRRR